MTLYVDDPLIFSSNLDLINDTKQYLKQNFEIKDMGCIDTILGIKVLRKENAIILNHFYCTKRIFTKYSFTTHDPKPTTWFRPLANISCINPIRKMK